MWRNLVQGQTVAQELDWAEELELALHQELAQKQDWVRGQVLKSWWLICVATKRAEA